MVELRRGGGSRAGITLASDGDAIAAVSAFVHEFCAVNGLDDGMAARLGVVIEELLTNSLKYAFADAGRHDIRVELALDGGAITIVYEDDGIPFDPFAIDAPSFETPVEEWPIGRLGVHLVRFLTDRFSYARAGQRNRITLVKAISGAGTA